MKLQKIVSRLQELHPKEIDLSLDRIQNLCERLGNPQDKLKAISIVGTNGKYSTIQAMFAILKEANIKCNIYTSPHIKNINERFVFNNQELNDEELASLFEEIESTNNNEPITFFEILTAVSISKKVIGSLLLVLSISSNKLANSSSLSSWLLKTNRSLIFFM